MTVSDMRGVARDYLTPAEIAPALGCTPYAINQQAAADPAKLGFPVVIVGKRVKIPRKAFIRFMCGEKEEGN